MKYYTYQVAIVTADFGIKFIDVVAVGIDSAKADVYEAYGEDVEIASVCQK